MNSLKKCLFVFAFIVCARSCYSQVPSAAVQESATQLESELRGKGWGAGVALLTLDGEAPVKSAVVDADGILRVTPESKARASGVIEMHYLRGSFADVKRISDSRNDKVSNLKSAISQSNAASKSYQYVEADFAHGPVGVLEFGGDVVRSIGIGYMFSWSKYDVTVDNGRLATVNQKGFPFNVSVFAFVEPNVQTLGDGLVRNNKVPEDVPVQLVDEARSGCGLMFSTNF